MISAIKLADQMPSRVEYLQRERLDNFHDMSTKFAGIPCNKDPREEDSCDSFWDSFWGIVLLSVELLVTLPVAFKPRFLGKFQGGRLISGISAHSFFVTIELLGALR